MPQGKGTYGSQVGRPSKKKYVGGGNVDPFSTKNPEGVPAEQVSEAMEKQNMAKNMEDAIPTTNAMERSQVSPDVTEYKEGGFIKKAIGKYKREKARKKSVKDYPITGVVQPEKKGLKPAKVPSNPPLFKGDTTKEKILNTSILYNMGKKAGKKKAGKKKVEAGK